MNWRERYARYRRYGLDPLPADASAELREARIAELRRLRHARRRRIAIRGGIGSLALALLAALLLYWLLMTIGGRDVLLRQVAARLPAGSELTWKSAAGPASGPMTLHGVHVSLPRQRDPGCVPSRTASCAMGRIAFDADTVVLDPAILPLLGKRLRLDALDVRGATLDLPRSDRPFQLPKWPDVLPDIAPPLALQADAIRIDDLEVSREGEPLVVIHGARGGLDADSGKLHVERLRVDSDRGEFTLHGDYAPRDDYRSDLVATAVLPAPAGRTAPRLGLVAKGDLSRMDVAIAGRMPAPTRATLTLRGDKDAPGWHLRANSTALDLSLLSGSGEASTPLAFDLQADGVGGKANVRGNVQQGDFKATLQPSKLGLEDRLLHAQPLVLDVFDGRVVANGVADLRDPRHASLKLAANARGLQWQGADGTTRVRGGADFGLAGKPDLWAAIGTATLQRGDQRAQVHLDGIGGRDGVRIRALQATMPQGRLDATGTLAWNPHLAWKADATLAGFDPGYFAPDWPGAIDGKLQGNGRVRGDGSLLAHVEARALDGALRKRALSGHATLDVDGDAYSGDVALALGRSRLEATGRVATAMQVDAEFSPLRLDDLLPDGRGTLRGTLQLRGARDAPDVAVDLDGSDLAFGDYRAGRLAAKGRLPWKAGNGALALDARGLQLGLPFADLRANLRGAVERLRFDAEARGDVGAIAVGGDAGKDGARWQGRLATLRFEPARGAQWTLQQPARWSWDGRNGALSRACLASSAGGDLCADADWPRRGLNVRGERLPLALLVPYLPERGDGRPWVLAGDVGVDARIAPAGKAWRGTASIVSAHGGLRNRARARRDVVSYDGLELRANFDPGRIEATLGAAFNGNGRVDAHLATGWDGFAPLSGEVTADTDELTWMELFSPDIVEPAGRLALDLRLAGTRAAPTLGGSGRLRDSPRNCRRWAWSSRTATCACRRSPTAAHASPGSCVRATASSTSRAASAGRTRTRRCCCDCAAKTCWWPTPGNCARSPTRT